MKIQNSPKYKPNFCAVHFAQTKNFLQAGNIETSIDIFKISKYDEEFFKELKNTTNLKSLMPKLSETHNEIWHQIFQIAAHQVTDTNKKGFLAVYNNKPCGIIAFTPNDTKYKLNIICTWPAEPEQKVPNAGKTLFKIMFEDFIKSSANIVDLDAVTNGPFNAVSKYMSLGFKQRGGENGIIEMRILRDTVIESLKKLNKFIDITLTENPRIVNLLDKLDI